MSRFSEIFSLNKTQFELDFVDIDVERDMPLFIDPFAISQRLDDWSQRCHHVLKSFFQQVLDHLREGDSDAALLMLSHFREPNEIHFGLSKGKAAGAGIGNFQARQIFTALRGSSAVGTGFLSSIEECELMIDGIGQDKISDLTANVIRSQLIDYTRRQCELHGIAMQHVSVPPSFNGDNYEWESRYENLPVWQESPLVLVPKSIARYSAAYNHYSYYNNFVLEFLRAENLNANSSLVRTLKSGKRTIRKRDLKSSFPCTKKFLYEFSRDNPSVLEGYRQERKTSEKARMDEGSDPHEEQQLAQDLRDVLKSIPPGGADASRYHRAMVGIVELLFFPHLLNPMKEREIHDVRKRIDILLENGASDGIFHRLHEIRKLPCSFVPIECKNYLTEVANPELDQIAGRFSTNRGKFGIICCRSFEDRAKFVQRCRDTFRDDRGLIIALDDAVISDLLEKVCSSNRSEIDAEITRLVNEVWVD